MGRQHILIIEDSPLDQQLMKLAIQEHMADAIFRAANTLQEAHDMLSRGGVDCILLDLGLPDSPSGMDSFLKVHNAFPGIPLVIASHLTDLNLALKLIRLGAEDYLVKDYSNTSVIHRRILYAIERSKRNQRRLMGKNGG